MKETLKDIAISIAYAAALIGLFAAIIVTMMQFNL